MSIYICTAVFEKDGKKLATFKNALGCGTVEATVEYAEPDDAIWHRLVVGRRYSLDGSEV